MTPLSLAIRSSVLALLAVLAWPAACLAQPSEYQVKAAFLYNFVKFVEWPATQGKQAGPISLCVLGKDPFDGELARAVDGKTLDGRPFTIRQVSDAVAGQSCQVVFVSASEEGRAPEIMKRLAGWSVLTVGDTDRLWDCGVMITFLMDGQKVRFRINQGAAEQVYLKISSKLLQLGVTSVDKNR